MPRDKEDYLKEAYKKNLRIEKCTKRSHYVLQTKDNKQIWHSLCKYSWRLTYLNLMRKF